MRTSHQHGFTLVEVSVVMVAIALLAAGVLTAYNLIEQARLRKILTNTNEYKTIIGAFNYQFGALPGDMPNFYDYYPSCASSQATCNGDGNGYVDDSGDESKVAWQHLSLSGFTEKQYDFSASGVILGTCSPSFEINSLTAGYRITDSPSHYAYKNSSTVTVARNSIRVASGNSNDVTTAAILTPEQMYSLDVKVDDQYPLRGDVQAGRGLNNSSGDCIVTEGNASSAYTLTNASVACYPVFFLVQ